MIRIAVALAIGCAPKIDPGPSAAKRATEAVEVVEMADEASPNIYLQAIVAAGSAYDPVGQEGIAHLTARAMVDAGSAERTSQQIRDALYPTGNALQLVVDREWASFRLRCHRDHADLCIGLFTDVLIAPRFDTGDVVRLRDDAVYAVTDGLLADEEALGQEVLDATVFSGHPYGHPVAGRAGVLPTIGPDALRAFHGSHYVREAMHVGIAGGYTDDHLQDLRKRLLEIPGKRAPELALQKPIRVEGRSLTVVSTKTEVTGFHFAHPVSATRAHDDWPALFLAMTALGAHRQSFGRLYRTLRTARGLNYGDYAYIEPYVQRGWRALPEQGVIRQQPYFYVWLRPTSVDNGPFALKLAVSEVERFVADGLTAEEFADVRQSLEGSVPLLAQNPGRRLAYALDAAATGTANFLDLNDALASVTLDDVNAALQRHIRPDDLVIVAVTGAPDELRSALLGEAATPIVYNDVTPDDAQAARDDEAAAIVLGIAEDDAWVVEAEGLFR